MNYKNNLIPKRFQALFKWICHADYFDELDGDLRESFHINNENYGIKYAKNQYRKEVIKMLRPSVIKSLPSLPKLDINTAVLLSYSKTTLRGLVKHKVFSVINISGLAIGMTMSLLIMTLVADLLKFDEFHQAKDNIYRIITTSILNNGRMDKMATTTLPLAAELAIEDGIDETVRIRRHFSAEATITNKILPLRGHLAEPSFFNVFTFPFIKGDASTALEKPFSIVLTEKAATKLFGDIDAMGEIVKMGSYGEFMVTGIIENIPLHSHLQFEVLGSLSSLPTLEKSNIVHSSLDEWNDISTNYVYVKVSDSQDPRILESKINSIALNQYSLDRDSKVSFRLQSIRSIVPGEELSNKIGPTMIMMPIVILSTIALLILLSACFNYTNLSIARSLKRAREIGIRKVVGAGRKQIIFQFMVEAIVVALFSLLLAIGLFQIIKPGFFSIIPNAEFFSLSLEPKLLLIFLVFAMFCGIIAGIIPALTISKVRPVLVLKNMISERLESRFTFRKVLTTFQFALSMIFIIGSSIVLKQYKYTLNRDFGFDQENILSIDLFDTDHNMFKSEFSKFPEVNKISFSSLVAGLNSTSSTWVKPANKQDSTRAYYISIDHEYIDNHDLNLIAGRNFTENLSSNPSNSIIVNQNFLKRYQWEVQEALEKSIEFEGNLYSITGVIEDFNYTHLEEPISNFFFINNPRLFTTANVKLASHDIPKSLARMASSWLTLKPNHSFSATFLDEQIANSYDFLLDAMKLFGFFAALAISIACLGMLGMAIYTAEARAKEVSLRKIFGAGLWSIFHSLSSRFYSLIIIAAIFACPLVYLLFDKVILAGFAFRIQIGLWEMLSGFLLILVLGLLSIGSQTFKAAKGNHVKVLQS